MTSFSEPEWRSKPLSERLAFAYNNQLFTDIDITLSSGGVEHRYKAHGCILAHFSPELERIIYGDVRKDKTRIKVADVDPEGLSYILKYLYHVPTNDYKKKDKSVLLAAYHASQKFSMTAISTELRNEIFEDLLTPSLAKEDDFWKLLELSRILGLKDVMTELVELGGRYPKDVLKARSLVKASVKTLKCVIDLEILNVTEIEILDCIVRWKEGNSKLPFVDNFVKDLLDCVRFRNLSPIDLRNFLMNHMDLISPDDTSTILRSLSQPSSNPLPSWCSQKFRISPSLIPKDYNAKQLELTSSKSSSTKQRRSSTLLKLFAEQKYSDVCFRVGSTWIKCHRNILAIGSVVFEKMFFGPLPDRRYGIEVSVPKGSDEGFRTMIRYFYQDSDLDALLTKNSKLAVPIFDVSLKYGSNILKSICQSYMISNNQFKVGLNVQSKVNPNAQSSVTWNPMPKSIVPSDVKSSFQSNVKSSDQSSSKQKIQTDVQSNVKLKVQPHIPSNIKSNIQTTAKPDQSYDQIQLSPKLFWGKLQSQITKNQPQNDTVNELLDYASKNTRDVLECSDFLNANSESIAVFLSSHDLNIKGIDLLNKVAEWIEQKPDYFAQQRMKYEVLSGIRFDDITPPEFCSFLSKHRGILTTEESLAILMHLVDNVSELPSWCYKGPQIECNAASQIDERHN